MGWTKIDDRWRTHRKRRLAGPEAADVIVAAWCYCSDYLTDGVLDEHFFTDELPDLETRQRICDRLIRIELLDVLTAGEIVSATDSYGYEVKLGPLREDVLVVHDYLDYNPSREYVEERREKERAKKRKAREKAAQAPNLRVVKGPGGDSAA